jgi:hypothetical protein
MDSFALFFSGRWTHIPWTWKTNTGAKYTGSCRRKVLVVDAAYIQNKNEKTHRKGTLELIDLYMQPVIQVHLMFRFSISWLYILLYPITIIPIKLITIHHYHLLGPHSLISFRLVSISLFYRMVFHFHSEVLLGLLFFSEEGSSAWVIIYG